MLPDSSQVFVSHSSWVQAFSKHFRDSTKRLAAGPDLSLDPLDQTLHQVTGFLGILEVWVWRIGKCLDESSGKERSAGAVEILGFEVSGAIELLGESSVYGLFWDVEVTLPSSEI